jgi:hypothetical protein
MSNLSLEEIEILDNLIDQDKSIPSWIKKGKRELLRATFFGGQKLLNNGFTIKEVKSFGWKFSIAHLSKKEEEVWKCIIEWTDKEIMKKNGEKSDKQNEEH